jgi:hypothetical protein
MSEPVSHPLEIAAYRTGRDTIAVLAAQTVGEGLDAEVDAVATLVTRAELESLAKRICAAAGHENDFPVAHRWRNDGVSRVRTRALALFGDADWVLDLR